ncbi:MAG: endonuclease [Phycisphaerae bacterium]|nr:endonuclease [Phycisphaerae bacterium]
MKSLHLASIGLALGLLSLLSPREAIAQDAKGPVAVRVATFNIEDLRTAELIDEPSDRVLHAAEIIQRIRPNIILINEVAYDMPGGPDYDPSGEPGANADRLARVLAEPVRDGLEGMRYRSWTAAPNTGRASGYDLDRSGEAVTEIPTQPTPNADGSPVSQTSDDRAYGADAWGFGTFPGQYGMTLLIDERLEIDEAFIRTFRLFPWSFMPNNLMPTITNEAGETVAYYPDEVGNQFRLSSKSHWDIPVRMPNGERLHVLCSHPTPPAFDGDEKRNARRNHDEIRFWADYIDNASYVVDDKRRPGGLPPGSHFVIVGDLNADPDEGTSVNDPIGRLLLNSRHLAADPRPTSNIDVPGLDPDDTSGFRLRVDYVLPSKTLRVLNSGVWRTPPSSGDFPSDHFPVWVDLVVPASSMGRR